jgi:hypothetical protein
MLWRHCCRVPGEKHERFSCFWVHFLVFWFWRILVRKHWLNENTRNCLVHTSALGELSEPARQPLVGQPRQHSQSEIVSKPYLTILSLLCSKSYCFCKIIVHTMAFNSENDQARRTQSLLVTQNQNCVHRTPTISSVWKKKMLTGHSDSKKNKTKLSLPTVFRSLQYRHLRMRKLKNVGRSIQNSHHNARIQNVTVKYRTNITQVNQYDSQWKGKTQKCGYHHLIVKFGRASEASENTKSPNVTIEALGWRKKQKKNIFAHIL